MPGALSRRSMAHFGVSQRVPLRNSLSPSRRQSRQTGPVIRAIEDFDFYKNVVTVLFRKRQRPQALLRADYLSLKALSPDRASHPPASHPAMGLHAPFLGRTATVVRQRSNIFDRFDRHSSSL